MHTTPMSYLQQANRAEGGHFFDDEAMKCFDSRIESDVAFFNPVTEDAFFVTSERMSLGSPRLFKVRRFDGNCRVRTTGRPCYDKSSALLQAQELAQQRGTAFS